MFATDPKGNATGLRIGERSTVACPDLTSWRKNLQIDLVEHATSQGATPPHKII